MDRAFRSILLILVALVILSSFSAVWFFVVKEKLYNNYMDLEVLFESNMERLNREVTALDKENKELQEKVVSIKKELNILESKNEELNSQYRKLLTERDDLNQEIARVKKGKFFLEKTLKEMESDRFVAGLLREKASLEVELERLKESSAPKESEVRDLRDKNSELNIKVSKLEEEKDLLEQKISDAVRVSELLSTDLLKEKDKNKKDKEEFANLNVENSVLKTKITELERTSERFDRMFVEKDNMVTKISNLEKDLEFKSQEIDKLKVALATKAQEEEARAEAYTGPEEVNLPPIVLESSADGAGRVNELSPVERITRVRGLKGRIITVNREHNFVVIDLGREDGIDKGTRLDVYRGNLTIGSIEVIQVRDRIAACDIKYVQTGARIETDDVVMR